MSSESDTDPLSALVIDGEELDKERIVAALAGVAGLNKQGEVVQLGGFSTLTARQKILAYLLAYKAAELLGLRSGHTVGSAELARSIGIAEGTVYPTVSQLRNDRAISQDTHSKCYIAHHQVASATAELAARADSSTSTPGRVPARKKTTSRRRSPKTGSKTTTPSSSTVSAEEASAPAKISKARSDQRTRSASEFSPASAIRDMISEGFFADPRGIGEVRTHLKDVHARDVPVTTLSPIFTRLLRAKELTRTKSDSGKYRYVATARHS